MATSLPSSSSSTAPASSAEAERGHIPPECPLGSLVSLTAKSGIRFEGFISSIDSQNQLITLHSVRSFGTEGRRKDSLRVAPSEKVYEHAEFADEDIKEIQVLSKPSVDSSDFQYDPAIIEMSSLKSQSIAPSPVQRTMIDAESSTLERFGVVQPAISNTFAPQSTVDSAPQPFMPLAARLQYHGHSSTVHTSWQSDIYRHMGTAITQNLQPESGKSDSSASASTHISQNSYGSCASLQTTPSFSHAALSQGLTANLGAPQEFQSPEPWNHPNAECFSPQSSYCELSIDNTLSTQPSTPEFQDSDLSEESRLHLASSSQKGLPIDQLTENFILALKNEKFNIEEFFRSPGKGKQSFTDGNAMQANSSLYQGSREVHVDVDAETFCDDKYVNDNPEAPEADFWSPCGRKAGKPD